MNCVHVVVNRVFRRRLINHLALENCTKRHKKLSNLLQITQTSLNNKQQHHRHQNWNVNSSILTQTIQGVFCYVEKVGQFHFGDEHPSKVICCYIQTFHFHSQNPDQLGTEMYFSQWVKINTKCLILQHYWASLIVAERYWELLKPITETFLSDFQTLWMGYSIQNCKVELYGFCAWFALLQACHIITLGTFGHLFIKGHFSLFCTWLLGNFEGRRLTVFENQRKVAFNIKID